jgi:ElaB/YqjD/DUF883 family membrane-anchored ribosome-binding protein
MDEEPNVIRQHIDETRSSLTEKLETLENQVLGTVRQARESVEDTIASAKETVEGTIATVKSSVHDTMTSVKQTLDVGHQVREHPFASLGVALVSGVVCGAMFGGSRRRGRIVGDFYQASTGPEPARAMSSFRGEDGLNASHSNGGSWSPVSSSHAETSRPRSGFLGQFDEELNKLKGLAIGTLMGVVRDAAKQSLPASLVPQVESLVDSATVKLGGQPVAGRVLS